MSEIFVTQLLEQAMSNVNVPLVVALMAIGFIIKHFSLFEKIENDLIPPVLLVFSIIVLLFENGGENFIATIIAAIVNAAVAIGLHQQGKNIFTVTIIPSIGDIFGKLFKKDEEAPELPDVEVDEEVEDNEDNIGDDLEPEVEGSIEVEM